MRARGGLVALSRVNNPGFRNSDEKFRIAKKIDRRLSPCGLSHFDAFTGFYCGAVRISGDNPLNHKHYFSSQISRYFDCGIRVQFRHSSMESWNQVDTDVSKASLRIWMPAIHAGMTRSALCSWLLTVPLLGKLLYRMQIRNPALRRSEPAL